MRNSVFLLISFVVLVSCQNSKNPNDYTFDIVQPTESIYDPSNYFHGKGSFHKRYGILLRSMHEYDIKPQVSIDYITFDKLGNVDAGTDDIHIDFSFYNYDSPIRISNKVIPDIFMSKMSEKIYLFIVEDSEISQFVKFNSEKYGEWGNVTITKIELSVVAQNVIVTPLAAKFLSNRSYNDNGVLVFVRFENSSERLYKDYLFLGDYMTGWLIKNHYNSINTKSNMWSAPDNSWSRY